MNLFHFRLNVFNTFFIRPFFNRKFCLQTITLISSYIANVINFQIAEGHQLIWKINKKSALRPIHCTVLYHKLRRFN